jgi:hypothetical protein
VAITTYSFNPPTWNSGDDITIEKLNDSSESLRYLKDNIPEGRYNFDGSIVIGGMAIYATNARLSAKESNITHTRVNFPANLFDPAYRPIVTATAGYRSKLAPDILVFVTSINGDPDDNWADHTGCRIVGYIPPNDEITGVPRTFKSNTAVNVIAIGPAL